MSTGALRLVSTRSVPGALLVALLAFIWPLAAAKVKYPKTAPCPIDGATAKATGKPTPTLDPQCVSVAYQHKGTDYTNRTHPQRFKHEFSLNICDNTTTNAPAPPK